MDQQQWDKLEHIVTVELEDFKDIYMVRSDGVTVNARPLKTHLHMLKCFLLRLKRHIIPFIVPPLKMMFCCLRRVLLMSTSALTSRLKIMHQPLFRQWFA
jgi:hypothetical protein